MSLNKSFIPQSNIPYPEQTDGHYLKIKKDDGTVFDKDYPYVDKSKKFRFKQWWVRVLLYLIVFPMSYIRMGLKIRGKKNIRKNKRLLKQGVISISNHVNMWDYIAVMNAIKPFRSYVLVWNKNVSGESGPLVRLVGGIPIPENDFHATEAYLDAVKDLFDNGPVVVALTLNVLVSDAELGELGGELAVVVSEEIVGAALQRDAWQHGGLVARDDVAHVGCTVAADAGTHGIDVAEHFVVHHAEAEGPVAQYALPSLRAATHPFDCARA